MCFSNILQSLPLVHARRPRRPVDELPHLRQSVVHPALRPGPVRHVRLHACTFSSTFNVFRNAESISPRRPSRLCATNRSPPPRPGSPSTGPRRLPRLRWQVFRRAVVADRRGRRQADVDREVRLVRRGRRQQTLQLGVGPVLAGVGLVPEVPRLDLGGRYGGGRQQVLERQQVGQVELEPVLRDAEHQRGWLDLCLRDHLALAGQRCRLVRRSLFGDVHTAPPRPRTSIPVTTPTRRYPASRIARFSRSRAMT